jgi:hypothetical protein
MTVGETGVRVAPGLETVLTGQGSGAVAAEESELVDQNRHLVETFKKSVADNVGDTINYDALDLADSSVILVPLGVTVQEDKVSTQLDLIVVADE